MHLSAPSFITFLLALAFALLAFLPLMGVNVPYIGLTQFWLVAIAYLLLAAGALFRGL
jgi:hypothetical protein